MRFGKFNIRTFIMTTINCLGLTFVALVGTAAVDEGTEGDGFLGMIAFLFSKLFDVV